MKKYLFALMVLLAGFRTVHCQCTADAGPNQTITCYTPQVTLQGSSNVPAATYAWSGPGGFNSNMQNPVVGDPGAYSLTITDPSNNCTATASTSVFLNTSPPILSLAGGTLTCAQTTVTIIVTVFPGNCTFSWTGPNGYTSFTQNPVVSWPGQYTVVAVNTVNGCTAEASVVIDQDIAAPGASATGGTLGCSNPVTTLTGNSPTAGVTFQWSGPNGFNSTQQNPPANAPGDYILIVTSPNGCTSTAVATVTLDGTVPQILATITPISCFNGADGSIDVQVNGGVQPYNYLWSNNSTTANQTNLSAGIYALTLTDNTGCSIVRNFVLSQPADISIPPNQVTITAVSCFGLNNGAIAIQNPTGGTPPFTYSWFGPGGSVVGTSQTITGLPAGLYSLTLTDSKGCSKQYQYLVNQPLTPLIISNSISCENNISVGVTGGVPPYSYLWSNGNTTPTSIFFVPGTYTITITDNNGCTAIQTYTVGPNTTPCTRITGQIILDENENCQNDPPEPGLGTWFLKAEGPNGTFYGLSGMDGRYTITLEPGDYTLSLIPQGYQPTICQNDIPVSLAQQGDSTQVDFLVQLLNPDCPALTVDLSTPVLRRCFSNNFYYLQYCNTSPAKATDAYITLELDPFLAIQNAEIPYTDLGNGLFRFDLGTVPPNFCGAFWVRVNVSCAAIIGQTHCSEAHIYPDTACAPVNPQWSGAHLEVRSECAGDSLRFIIKNIGAGDMSEALEYIVIEDGIMSRQGSTAPLLAGAEMTVAVPANGATWRIEADQEPFSPRPDQPLLSVEGCTSTGSFTTGFVNQFPLGDAGPWFDVDCTPNIGSWDPNDKQGFPLGYGPDRYIRPGTELEYLIRFQNTGTDTAFNVVIRDTLANWLDPLTVRIGASSHDYRFELAGEGVLIFDFQNILLPDSNVNEPLSHGAK